MGGGLPPRKRRQNASLRIPHVDRGDVRELVIVEGEEALAGREGLHRQRERRDVEQHHVARAAERGGIAVIAEVLEQDRRPVPRLPVEFLLMEGERVFERAGEIGRQIGLDRVDVEQRQVLGFERREMEARRVLRDMLGLRVGARLGRVGLGRSGLDRLGDRLVLRRRRNGVGLFNLGGGVGGRGRRRLVGRRLRTCAPSPKRLLRAPALHMQAGARRNALPPFTVPPRPPTLSLRATAIRQPD